MAEPIPIEGLEEPALSVLVALRTCRLNPGWHRHAELRRAFRGTLRLIRRAAGPILQEWFRVCTWKSPLYDEATGHLRFWLAQKELSSRLRGEIEEAVRDLEAASVGLWRSPDEEPGPRRPEEMPHRKDADETETPAPEEDPEDALLEVMQQGPPVASLSEDEVVDYVALLIAHGRLTALRSAAAPASGYDVRIIRKTQPGTSLAERLPREPVRLHFPSLRTVRMVCGKEKAWPDVREEVDQDLAEWAPDFCGVCVLIPASPLQGGRRIPHGNLPPSVRDRVSHRAFAPCPLEHYVDRMLEVGIAAPRRSR